MSASDQIKQEILDLFARYGAQGDVTPQCAEVINDLLDEILGSLLRDADRLQWLFEGMAETEIRRRLQIVMDTYYMGSFKTPLIKLGDFRGAIDLVRERYK